MPKSQRTVQPHRLARLVIAVVASLTIGLSTTTTAPAQLPPGQPFEIYAIHDTPDGVGSINVGTVPWKSICALWEAQLGRHPLAGPHMIMMWPGGSEAFYAEHLAALALDVAYAIPDPDYNGLVSVDIETWNPWWTGHINVPSSLPYDALDYDKPDDWRDYIRQYQPELLQGRTPAEQEDVFKSTWLKTTREYFTRTVGELKRLRPRAKFGLYSFPQYGYHDWEFPQSVANVNARYQEEVPWVAELFDVMMPGCYWYYYTIPTNAVPALWQDEPAAADRHLRSNVEQAKIIGNGKPVYLWVSSYYMVDNSYHPLQPLNDINMRMTVETPLSAGADGIILWNVINYQWQLNIMNTFLHDAFNPYMLQMLQNPRLQLGLQYRVRQLIPGNPGTPCRVDIGGPGGSRGPDGQVTVDDLVVYLSEFFAGNQSICDLVGVGGLPIRDGLITVDDLTEFFSEFFSNCP
ncbi:MAG: GC-type dockerin domain-anchored protein [Phycisphaerales bacterium]